MLTKLTEQEKKDAAEMWSIRTMGAPSSAWGSYNAGLIAGRAEGAALRKAAEALLEAVMTSRVPIPLWGEWGKELTALRELLFAQSAKPSAAPDYKPVPYEPHDAMQAIRYIEDWACKVSEYMHWHTFPGFPRFEPLRKQAADSQEGGRP